MVGEEKTRIDFNAPSSLVKRVDAIAELLDTSRTRILIDALRDELEELVRTEEVQWAMKDAFYDGRIEFDTVESVLGTEEALRMQLLRDSIDREPPEPAVVELPSDAEFYTESIPEWTPEGDQEDVDSRV